MRQVGEYPLWIGTARDARDIRAVLDADIEAVVDLAMEEPPVALTRELVYLRFPLLDGEGNPVWLLRSAVVAVSQLIAARVPTLVACSAGMSRSPCRVGDCDGRRATNGRGDGNTASSVGRVAAPPPRVGVVP